MSIVGSSAVRFGGGIVWSGRRLKQHCWASDSGPRACARGSECEWRSPDCIVFRCAVKVSTNAMPDPVPHIPPDEPSIPRSAIPAADLERIYADLRRHAQNLLAEERPAHTLQATALVHEALGKLLAEFGERVIPLPPESALAERRKVLFAMISRRMRQVLVEHARHRNALKGPGQWTRSPLHEAMARIDAEGVDLLDLDRALAELQRVDADAAAVFQHRWFGGLSMEHVAIILEISADEAQRRWTRARKFMRAIMRGGEE